MDSLTQQLMQSLFEGGLSQISEKFGIDEGTISSTISAATPLLVSALAKNASEPEQAQALHRALDKDHDGTILNDLTSFLGDPQSANGTGILGHILGSQQSKAAQGLAENTGLSKEQAEGLLEIAAPLLMGALGQEQQEQGLDTNGLSEFLGEQQQIAEEANPQIIGMLNKLLDKNQDGSFLDDIFRMIMKFFGKK